jgi:hypothetical protein
VDRKFVSNSPAEAAAFITRPDAGASPISLQDSDVVPDHDNVLSGSPTTPDALLQNRDPAARASIANTGGTESPIGFKTEGSPHTPQGTILLHHALLHCSVWWKASYLVVAVFAHVQSFLMQSPCVYVLEYASSLQTLNDFLNLLTTYMRGVISTCFIHSCYMVAFLSTCRHRSR